MQLDEAPRERQAEAGALGLARVVAPDLPELLEHRLLVLRRDADAGVADRDLDAPFRSLRARPPRVPPSGVNFTAFDSRFSTICLNLRSSAANRAQLGSTRSSSVMPCRCARSRTSVIALSSASAGRTSDSSSSMRPASILDRSRMSLMSESRCLPEAWMSLRYSSCFVVQLAEHPLEQHLGEADDRVQRRAQLVRHVGEELGLVLVGDFELAALLLDLVEQPHVLDRDHRLVGEGLEQRDLLLGERPHFHAAKDDDARSCLEQQGHDQNGAIARLLRLAQESGYSSLPCAPARPRRECSGAHARGGQIALPRTESQGSDAPPASATA